MGIGSGMRTRTDTYGKKGIGLKNEEDTYSWLADGKPHPKGISG